MGTCVSQLLGGGGQQVKGQKYEIYPMPITVEWQ